MSPLGRLPKIVTSPGTADEIVRTAHDHAVAFADNRSVTAHITYIPRPRSRLLSLDAVRLLALSGVVSWSAVAVETWMLVR